MISTLPLKAKKFFSIESLHSDYIMGVVLLATVYALAGRLGSLFATADGNITLIWPPSGIALAALIIFGNRLWPGILIGAIIADFLATNNVLASIGMAVGSTVSSLMGSLLVSVFIGKENPLSRTINLYKFFIIVPASTAIAAFIGTIMLVINGVANPTNFDSVMLTWWLGDTIGILVFAPLFLAWQNNIQLPLMVKPKYLETAIFTILLISTSSLPFILNLPLDIVGYPLAFISFPFCIWAAYRYCMKQVTITIVIIMIVAIYGTITEQGPFHKDTLAESLFLLQTFMLIIVTTTLSLASAVFERQRFEFRLIEQREKAEELTLAKSQFMSNMSHELRTPLNAIIGFSHILEQDDSNLNKQQHEFINYISDAGSHLLHLVNDLLDIEQGDAKKLNIQLTKVNLNTAMLESIRFIEHMADKRNISINFEKGTNEELHVFADKVRLRQVLINLLSNAAKYNPEGGSITVTCGKQDSSHTRIAITDTGDGISEEHIDKIFEPFNRAQIEGSRIEGSGIGLTVAQKLVELMHGTISVESEIGKGSTFTIILPS